MAKNTESQSTTRESRGFWGALAYGVKQISGWVTLIIGLIIGPSFSLLFIVLIPVMLILGIAKLIGLATS